jgi:hypothetical protein
MPNTTVFLLNIIDSNSLHGPVRELHQDNGISNQSIAGRMRGNKREVTIGTAHTDTVNSLNETINQSINRLFAGLRVGLTLVYSF